MTVHCKAVLCYDAGLEAGLLWEPLQWCRELAVTVVAVQQHSKQGTVTVDSKLQHDGSLKGCSVL
jgi:hypothetical protein